MTVDLEYMRGIANAAIAFDPTAHEGPALLAMIDELRAARAETLTVERLAVCLDFVDKRLSFHDQAAAILAALKEDGS